ncbi:MAG TPA: glycosyltransferase family 2 protein [Nitrolancea sp.]|nr:glycosyltransferase family 2 protein [Nitrolancea sp.]
MDADVFPKASVIVFGYNSRRFLDVCFTALLTQAYPGNFEVLFIDNTSTDGSVAYVQEHFPSVRVIESGENLGYAGGNNLGAKFARGDVLAFINPDTQAESDWLRELVRPLVLDSSIGLTTSKIVLIDNPDVINTCGNDLTLAGIATCRLAGEEAEKVTADEDVSAVSGAACAIRADLFLRLGGFDERFWMYLEDTDLSWRARLAGYRCRLAARSVVAHHYTFRLPPGKTRVIERNRYRMLAKNLSGWMLVALIPCLVVGELMTWGWAVLRGPRHLWAKTLAALWLFGHLFELQQARQLTQVFRRVSDGVILRHHLAIPPVSAVATGLVARIACAMLLPLGMLTAGLALGLAGVIWPDSPARPVIGPATGVVKIEGRVD